MACYSKKCTNFWSNLLQNVCNTYSKKMCNMKIYFENFSIFTQFVKVTYSKKCTILFGIMMKKECLFVKYSFCIQILPQHYAREAKNIYNVGSITRQRTNIPNSFGKICNFAFYPLVLNST